MKQQKQQLKTTIMPNVCMFVVEVAAASSKASTKSATAMVRQQQQL